MPPDLAPTKIAGSRPRRRMPGQPCMIPAGACFPRPAWLESASFFSFPHRRLPRSRFREDITREEHNASLRNRVSGPSRPERTGAGHDGPVPGNGGLRRRAHSSRRRLGTPPPCLQHQRRAQGSLRPFQCRMLAGCPRGNQAEFQVQRLHPAPPRGAPQAGRLRGIALRQGQGRGGTAGRRKAQGCRGPGQGR